MKKLLAVILSIATIVACVSLTAYAVDVEVPDVAGAVNDAVATVSNEVNYYVGLVYGEIDYAVGEISTVIGDHAMLLSEKINDICSEIMYGENVNLNGLLGEINGVISQIYVAVKTLIDSIVALF